ncbi:MAG: hypothetical protein QW566_02085, partial [Candidatus Jordarchaeales archaeon]
AVGLQQAVNPASIPFWSQELAYPGDWNSLFQKRVENPGQIMEGAYFKMLILARASYNNYAIHTGSRHLIESIIKEFLSPLS